MGKGAQRSPAHMSEAEEKTTADVLIGGYLYDVASFKHPGGSIVKFLTNNGDATEAFEEFHGRSKKAQAMLRSLPKVAAPRDVLDAREGNGRTDLTRGYARLREEFAREGRFDPNRSEIVYRVGEVVLMHVVGAYLVLATGYAAAGIILLGLASGRCGWLMHEAGHYSLTGEISVDRALQELIYGVGCGMSGAWWRNQHNKHHATPQKLGADPDLQTLPLIAFHKIIGKKGNKAMRVAMMETRFKPMIV